MLARPRIADVLEHEPTPVGASVERIPSPPSTGDTLTGRLFGVGTGSVMLMAHMDTVYPEGVLAKRPFRIEGSRAYCPAVADAKGGIAVILHALKILKEREFGDFARITVVFNPDEERGSPGSGALIRRLAGEHDAVISSEPTSTPRRSGCGSTGPSPAAAALRK